MSFLYINNIRVFDNGTLSVIFSGLRPTARRRSIGTRAGARTIRQPALRRYESRRSDDTTAGTQTIRQPALGRYDSRHSDDTTAGTRMVCMQARGPTTCREKLRNNITSFNN